MPTFKVTAKRNIGGKIPKGTTVQVLTPSGINSLDSWRIKEALEKQLGISTGGFGIHTMDFDVVKL